MHVIAHGKGRGHFMYTIRLRESALEVDSGVKFPWHTGELNMRGQCTRLRSSSRATPPPGGTQMCNLLFFHRRSQPKVNAIQRCPAPPAASADHGLQAAVTHTAHPRITAYCGGRQKTRGSLSPEARYSCFLSFFLFR